MYKVCFDNFGCFKFCVPVYSNTFTPNIAMPKRDAESDSLSSDSDQDAPAPPPKKKEKREKKVDFIIDDNDLSLCPSCYPGDLPVCSDTVLRSLFS